jgi:hypothetical protein
MEIDAYLHSSYMLRPNQRDLLAHAIYELGNAQKAWAVNPAGISSDGQGGRAPSRLQQGKMGSSGD